MTNKDDVAQSEAKVIAVVGPTASGKSSLADALARRYNSEIVSADSMQIYQGMDIGTAKTPVAARGVRYHCIDIAKPDHAYSVALFQQEARSIIEDLLHRGVSPVLCGGTGLYVRAVLDSSFMFSSEDPHAQIRERYEKMALELGNRAFYEKLAEVDPKSAALMHPNNTRRVIRAFELLEEGSSYWQQHEGFKSREFRYPTVMLAIDMPRAVLYERCNKRVDAMLEAGLQDEVSSLLKEGYQQILTAHQAIGYKEMLGVLDGSKTIEKAVSEIKQNTRRYAKRQLTWFRADPRISWIQALGDDGSEKREDELVSEAVALIES